MQSALNRLDSFAGIDNSVDKKKWSNRALHDRILHTHLPLQGFVDVVKTAIRSSTSMWHQVGLSETPARSDEG